jgi:hypothetical protein
MLNTKHYLVNMPDPSMKQTLCAMPNTNEKPTSWDEIANGRFFIINSQHNIVASNVNGTTKEHYQALHAVALLHSVVKG